MPARPEPIDPAVTRECLHTLRNSGDIQEIGAAWIWLEQAYGYELAMEFLAAFDAEQTDPIQ